MAKRPPFQHGQTPTLSQCPSSAPAPPYDSGRLTALGAFDTPRSWPLGAAPLPHALPGLLESATSKAADPADVRAV
jgi:hypothetical protein